MSAKRKLTRLQARKDQETTKKLNRATDGKLRPEWVSRRPEKVSREEFYKPLKEDEDIWMKALEVGKRFEQDNLFMNILEDCKQEHPEWFSDPNDEASLKLYLRKIVEQIYE